MLCYSSLVPNQTIMHIHVCIVACHSHTHTQTYVCIYIYIYIYICTYICGVCAYTSLCVCVSVCDRANKWKAERDDEIVCVWLVGRLTNRNKNWFAKGGNRCRLCATRRELTRRGRENFRRNWWTQQVNYGEKDFLLLAKVYAEDKRAAK